MAVHPRGWQAALQAELGAHNAAATTTSCIINTHPLVLGLLSAFALGALAGYALSRRCTKPRYVQRSDKATETMQSPVEATCASRTSLPPPTPCVSTASTVTTVEPALITPSHPLELSETHRRMALLVASLGIDTADLTAGEKVQLLGVTVDLWNAMTSQHQQVAALRCVVFMDLAFFIFHHAGMPSCGTTNTFLHQVASPVKPAAAAARALG